MPINVNDSSKVVVSGGLWTGLANMRVTMINPTKAEMEEVGMKPQNEPEYLGTNANGNSKLRLDLYLNNPENKINAKRAFWLENEVRKNKAGDKVEWINKYGVTAWSTDETTPPAYDWFKKDGARPAYIGEGKFTAFIRSWANVDLDGQAILDDFKALATGNLAEIKSYAAALKTNTVKVLLGVKDGKYQDVYDGYFGRANVNNFDQWKKELAKDGNEFKSDYQNSLNLKPYVGTADVEGDTPTNMDTPTGGGTPNAGGGATGGYRF